MRPIPKIMFVRDQNLAEAARIEELLHQLKKEEKQDKTNINGTVSKQLRKRSAKPLYMGANPIRASEFKKIISTLSRGVVNKK